MKEKEDMGCPCCGVYFDDEPQPDDDDEIERDKRFESIKDSYLEDVWDEEVENILAGEVTHTTTQINRVEKPELNEDGEDKDGTLWPAEWDYMCNYALIPLPVTPH